MFSYFIRPVSTGILVCVPLLCAANYVVMPTYLNETATRGYISSSFNLANKDSKNIRLQPKIVPMQTAKNYQRITKADYPTQVYDLTQYTKVSPRLLIINPKQSRVLRVRIRLASTLPEGTYIGKLLIKMLPPENNNPLKKQREQTQYRINLTPLINTAIPLYITKGKPEIGNVSITCEQQQGKLTETVKNQSKWLQEIRIDDGVAEGGRSLRLAPMSQYTYNYKNNSQKITWQYKNQGDRHTVSCTP